MDWFSEEVSLLGNNFVPKKPTHTEIRGSCEISPATGTAGRLVISSDLLTLFETNHGVSRQESALEASPNRRRYECEGGDALSRASAQALMVVLVYG